MRTAIGGGKGGAVGQTASTRRGLVAGVDDLAVLHARDALGGGGDVVVVGDHQDRLPALVEAAEQLDHLVAALGVQGTRRLVREQEGRLVGEGPGDREALALPAGERARRGLGLVGQAEQVEQVPSPRLGRAPLLARDHRRQGDVLEHGHALEEVEELEDDADVLPSHAGQLVLRLAGDLLVGEHDGALVGLVEARHQVEQGGLAAARRSHDGDELAAPHLEVGAAQRTHGGVLGLEGAPHAPHVEHQVRVERREGGGGFGRGHVRLQVSRSIR